MDGYQQTRRKETITMQSEATSFQYQAVIYYHSTKANIRLEATLKFISKHGEPHNGTPTPWCH